MNDPGEHASEPATKTRAPSTSAPSMRPPRRRFIDVAVSNAIFLRSDPGIASMPPVSTDAPEVAFWGKSNVGKSSLLNALMLKKGLVKTSKTPGHTQLLNQFGVTVQLRRRQRYLTLVDLPGYGFAKMPKALQKNLGKMLGTYLSGRTQLSALVHLFDLRHDPTALDVETWQQVSALSPTRIVVGTKADRVPKSKQRAHAKAIAKAIGIHADDVTIFSAEDRQGRAALWARILAATGVAIEDLAPDDADLAGTEAPPTEAPPTGEG